MPSAQPTLFSIETTLNYAGPTEGPPFFGLEAYESNIAFEPHQVSIYRRPPDSGSVFTGPGGIYAGQARERGGRGSANSDGERYP